MKTLSVKKGLPVSVAGAPMPGVEKGADVSSVAFLPDILPALKPRLLVKNGDTVKIGTPLFKDKNNPDLLFLSPGGGIITDIRYGHRRAISRIVIQTGRTEDHEQFDPVDKEQLAAMDRGEMISTLMARGLWGFIRNLPYRSIPTADETPASLWVSLDPSDPFQVPSSVYLEGNESLFAYGVKVLERLGAPVFVCESLGSEVSHESVAPLITHRISGAYPAEDPGVVLYHTKTSPRENHAWFISGQDVLMLAEGLSTGRYPISRIVSISGSISGPQEGNGTAAPVGRYVKTRIGAPLASLVNEAAAGENRRWITGGLFRGRTVPEDDYLGLNETSLLIAIDAGDPELFGFLRPGLKKPTASRAFLYALHKKPFAPLTDMHGEERACINCGKCQAVCPVDIMVPFAYKSVYAGEIEDALAHGLLDCVVCGLCSFVCPAKIELAETFESTRHAYHQDRI